LSGLDFPNLLLNVATEIAGIAVTVWFVDKVITEHEAEQEAKRWKNVKFKVSWRIEVFINKSLDPLLKIIGLRDKITMAVFWQPMERIDLTNKLDLTVDPELLNPNVFAKNHPITRSLSEKLPTQEDMQALDKFTAEGYRTIEMFGSQFTPDVLDYMLKTLESLEVITKIVPIVIQMLEKTLADPENTEIYKAGTKEMKIISIASAYQDAIQDLVHLHNVLNVEK
jgi:hypothetical protein